MRSGSGLRQNRGRGETCALRWIARSDAYETRVLVVGAAQRVPDARQSKALLGSADCATISVAFPNFETFGAE
jgi:hypothetical protein